MKKQFTGYKVPKTLNLRQIKVSFFDKIPTLTDTNEFWYLFYNDSIKKWNIPQKCNGSVEDKDILTKIQAYISNHYGYDRCKKVNVLAELLPIAKEYAEVVYAKNNIKEIELKKRLKEKEQRDYERTQKQLTTKYEVKHLHKTS